jgi:hypothetical protein
MSFTRPITTPINTRSSQWPPFIYAEASGADWVCYEESDLFSPSLPAALGTNLLNTPTGVHAKFMGLHCPTYTPAGIAINTARSHDMVAGSGAEASKKWRDMNPSDGVFVDAGLGAWLTRMKSAGADVIYTVLGTPAWASARPSETGDPYGNLGAIAEPANMAKLGAFVTWLMTTYGSQIDYLEVWNEPKYTNTGNSFFSGTASKLAEIAKTINQAAKAVKPSIQILGVGCTGLFTFDGLADAGITHTNSFLAASDGAGGFGKDWIDILSVHTYANDGTNNLRYVPDSKTHLDVIRTSNGILGKPVWCTEYGYVTPEFGLYRGPTEGQIKAQVRYALQHVAAGMQRCVLYAYARTGMNWPAGEAGVPEWNRWCSIINGSTISVINRIGPRGHLACVINGQNYIV